MSFNMDEYEWDEITECLLKTRDENKIQFDL